MGDIPWLLLCALVWLLPSPLNGDLYTTQPKLKTKDGNLIIMAAEDRNITLRTSGKGYVNLNDHNLLHITQMAQEATVTVSLFEQNLQTNIQGRLDTLTRQISGHQGLSSKLAELERAVYRGNVSSNPSIFSSSRTQSQLNRLANRIKRVENRLRQLQNLLIEDECLSNPCRNGATCQDLFNGFMCICPTNWQGTLCDRDVNECAMYAGTDLGCQNGGTCINKPGTYECLCPNTYFGLHCTLLTNDCSSANSARLCGNGVCINQGTSGHGYTCICNQGWKTDPSGSCTVNVDECQEKKYPCSHDPYVACIDLPGSYHCGFCPKGFTGNGFQCADIDECQTDNGGCSKVPKVPCINTMGSRVCGSCPAGYTGDGVICAAVAGGVCAFNNGGCYPTAICFMTGDTVNCQCPNGYAGSGYGPGGCTPSALAVNPCDPNPCINGGTCLNVRGAATCVCHPHTTGPVCAIISYASCNPNPCNGGSCQEVQNGQVLKIRCTCNPGFEGPNCQFEATACGGTRRQDAGYLEFPVSGLSQMSGREYRCVWHIQVTPSKVVQFNISSLSIDPSHECKDNYLKIEEASPTRTSERFCREPATGMPIIKNTTSSAVDITYYSTSGLRMNTFKLNWKAVEPSCGTTFQFSGNTTSGVIDFPSNYRIDRDCEWKLLAQPGKKIQLTFNSLILHSSTDCSKDYIKVYEYVNSEPSHLLLNICNSSSVDTVSTRYAAAYVLFHSAGPAVGKGFKIMYTILDGCGGVITAGSGDISPPMDDDVYPDDQDCEWKIQLPLGDRVKITFNKFDIEQSEPCEDYVELWDGPSPTSGLVGRWCGSVLPPPFTSTSEFATIIFHSDFLFGGSGFSIHYETLCGGTFTSSSGEIKSPNYPLAYTSEQSCVYIIITPPSTAIQLQFQDFDVERTWNECSFDYLEVRDGDSTAAKLLGRFCGSSRPANVVSTLNYLYLVFNAGNSVGRRGFLANYSTINIPCGAIMKQSTGVFSAPQGENGYLPDSQCVWVISAPPGWAILLSFISFHLERSRDCNVDAVEVYENNTETGASQLLNKYCGNILPSPIKSTTSMLTVKFQSDETVHREGFTAHYVQLDQTKVCGGEYLGENGSLSSPNYPNLYPNNKECTWVIRIKQGSRVRLVFESFDVENGMRCSHDSLTIRDGPDESSSLVGKFCGNMKPPEVTSMTNALWMHFTTDQSISAKGFRATWDASIIGCGGTLTSMTGSIKSPNYPQPYKANAQCFFKISVSQGSQVRIFFNDLDLETNLKCSLDYIEIFDGLDDRSPSLGRFCSAQQHPISILATSNSMFIKFVADDSISGRGFHIKYQSECNVTLKGHYGAIESPNYPNNYSPELNCMWVIQAPLGNRLNISFESFVLEGYTYSNSCNYDYVEILESSLSSTKPSKSIAKLCGSELTTTQFNTSSEKAYIHFVTDEMLQFTGFRLEWVIVGCGGLLWKPQGHLTSPNYPNGYPKLIECEWKIVAPFNKSIRITLENIDMENMGGECHYDSLLIYAGEDNTAPLLLKACHRQNSPQIFTTSGNHALITFQADHSISGSGFYISWVFTDSKCGGQFSSPFGTIHSHNYPKNYNNLDDCEWLIEVEENHLVNLTFTDFDVEPSYSNITTDYVNVYDGVTVKAPLLLSHSGNELPASIISTGNTILVRHKADGSRTAKGFMAEYRLACGARILANGQGTFSLTDRPSISMAPWSTYSDANCTWYIIAKNPADKITLTFTMLDLSQPEILEEDRCKHNFITVHDGDDTNATIILRTCGTKVPPTVRSSGSAFTVHVARSSANRRTILGLFSAIYSTYSSACGGELESQQGLFSSPNFPGSYPPNANCMWQLTASTGNKVSLSFLSFELEEGEFCNTDYVEIRSESGKGTLLGVFCGSNLPNNLTAHNSLWVRFRSDTLGTAKGFMAQYSLVHGNDLTGDNGTIMSPMYPQPFTQQGEYRWTVTVPNNKVIRITFSNFYMSQNDDSQCYMNLLQIFNGLPADGDSTPPILMACGTALPSPVLSQTNQVSIFFQNDPYLQGSYFVLNWAAVSSEQTAVDSTAKEPNLGCGRVIRVIPTASNNSVVFTSPNYPHKYVNDLHCTWLIDTSPGFRLLLKFTHFDLETYRRCQNDYVSVFEESSTEVSGWKSLGEYNCLPSTLNLTFVAVGRMNVTMTTDRSVKHSGFSATVTAVCGGLLTALSGSLNTTDLPFNSTTNKVTCEWVISVRSSRTVQVKFIELNLPKHGQATCNDNFVMLRNGGFNISPPLGNGSFCGDVTPRPLTSSSNHIFISYSALDKTARLVLEYEEVDIECDHQVLLRPGLKAKAISSPNYPKAPSTTHITCGWSVVAPPGEVIQLHFNDRLDLKRSAGCTVEYVEVYDGGTELAPTLGRYCKNTPNPMTSRSNHLYIKYFTDTDTPNNGFNALVSYGSCNKSYFHLYSSLVVTSPQYPNTYLPGLDCVWRLSGFNEDTQLKVNVTELNLGNDSAQCTATSDYIEFINTDLVTKQMTDIPPPIKLCGQSSGQFNGTALIPPSLSSEMYIRFHSSPRTGTSSVRRFSITIEINKQSCVYEENGPSGEIVSKGYPRPAPRTNGLFCMWAIKVPEGRRVTLNIVDFDSEPISNNKEDEILIYSDGQFSHAISSQGNYTKIVESSGNTMRVMYNEKYVSGTHRGFKALWSSEKPSLCGGVLEGDTGRLEFSALGKNLMSYTCMWTHTKTGQSTLTATINGTFSPRNANDSACSFFSPFYDTLIISTSNSHGPRGVLAIICQETKMPYIFRAPSSFVNFKARKSGVAFRNHSMFQSIANFSIVYKTDACGGTVEGPQANISSPGYPRDLPPNTDCAWLVTFQPASTIKVTIEHLDLDADCSIDFLILYNGDTQMKPHLTQPLCGNQAPSPIITQTNLMLVEFHSGASTKPRTGFKLSLEEETTGCGGIIHNEVGALMSPNYGEKDYPNNVECDWKVIMPPGFHAGISFRDRFSLESSTGCTNDYIQIFNWNNETWQQIGSNLCGRVPPTTITTKTNKFRVLFRTSPSVSSDGFWLTWTGLCGGTFQVEGEGTIISPRYPNMYADSLNCKYTLVAPDKVITGRFEDFAIEEANNKGECKYDNVTLDIHSQFRTRRFRFNRPIRPYGPWDMDHEPLHGVFGISSHEPLMHLGFHLRPNRFRFIYHTLSDSKSSVTMCGLDTPSPVSSFNTLELTFKTDKNIELKGFLFRYSIESCGSNITSPTTITTPSLNFPTCIWFITAPKDQIVSVKVKTYDSSDCYLHLYEGHNITNQSNHITDICKRSISSQEIYTSTTNQMTMKYTRAIEPLLLTIFISFTYGEKQGCGGTVQLADLQLPYRLRSVDVNADGKYEPELYCKWLLLAPEFYQIHLTFNKLDLQNCSMCTCDYLVIYDGDNSGSPQIGQYCGNSLPQSTFVSTSGSLLVVLSTDGATELSGFELNVITQVNPCGKLRLNATVEVGVLKSPGYPDHLPRGSHVCQWFVYTSAHNLITLHMTDMNLPSPCSTNYLEITEMTKDIEHKICGNRTLDFTISSPARIRLFTSSNGGHNGFRLEYALKNCSGTYTEPYGRLVHNNESTSRDILCVNIIQTPFPNTTISFYFNKFVCLNYTSNSNKLLVFDGQSQQSDEVLSVCSNHLPTPVFSTGQHLLVKWLATTFYGSFDITYTTTDKGRGCGGWFNDVTGSFSSPLYPSSNNVDRTCRWDVSVPHGNKIVFTFTDFNIGSPDTCTSNYIQFFDVNSATRAEVLHSQYCGNVLPAYVQMTGSKAFVRYVTTQQNRGTGWFLKWTSKHNLNTI